MSIVDITGEGLSFGESELKSLIEKIALEFDAGEEHVDLTFEKEHPEYAAAWFVPQIINLTTGEIKIRPIILFSDCFKHVRGYGIMYRYGTSGPFNVIRLTKA